MSLNWGSLVLAGRAKAFGVPWNEEELVAVQSGISAEFVRQGILSKEEYEKVKDSKDLKFLKKPELQERATLLGIEFSGETTRHELIEFIGLKTSAEEAPTEVSPAEQEEDNKPLESPELPAEGQEK